MFDFPHFLRDLLDFRPSRSLFIARSLAVAESPFLWPLFHRHALSPPRAIRNFIFFHNFTLIFCFFVKNKIRIRTLLKTLYSMNV